MKKISVFVLILFAAFFMVQADYKIIFESKTDGYYYGGVNQPEEVYRQIFWVGKGKLAFITGARRVVVDLNSGKLALILTGIKKYALTELPFQMAGILPDNLIKYLESVQTMGTVKKKEGREKIGKYDCDIYESASWIMYQGDKVNQLDSTFYLSNDVGFDLTQFHQINLQLLALRNYNSEYINKLAKLKGIPVYTETFFYPKGFAVKNTSIMKSVEKLDPPEGIYTIPDGFQKAEKLTMQEFRTR